MKIGFQSEFGKFNKPDKEEKEAREYQASDEDIFFVVYGVIFIQWLVVYLIEIAFIISIQAILNE